MILLYEVPNVLPIESESTMVIMLVCYDHMLLFSH